MPVLSTIFGIPITLLADLFIAIFNVFGIISKEYPYWNPISFTLYIPQRKIDLKHLLRDKPINIESIEFSNILVSLSVFGRIIVHVRINDLKINTAVVAWNTYAANIVPSSNHARTTSNSNLQKKFDFMSWMQYFSLFVGLYVQNTELLLEHEGNVQSFIITKFRSSISTQKNNIDCLIEYDQFCVLIKTLDDIVISTLLKSLQLKTFHQLQLNTMTLTSSSQIDSLFVTSDPEAVIRELDIISGMLKFIRPSMSDQLFASRQRASALFDYLDSVGSNNRDDHSNSELSQNTVVAHAPFNIHALNLSIKFKEIGISRADLSISSLEPLVCFRDSNFDTYIMRNVSSSELISLPSLQKCNFVVVSLQDSESNIIGSNEQPWFDFKTFRRTEPDDVSLLSTCTIKESDVSVDISSLSSLLFFVQELSVTLKAHRLVMRTNSPINYYIFNEQNIPRQHENVIFPFKISISISSLNVVLISKAAKYDQLDILKRPQPLSIAFKKAEILIRPRLLTNILYTSVTIAEVSISTLSLEFLSHSNGLRFRDVTIVQESSYQSGAYNKTDASCKHVICNLHKQDIASIGFISGSILKTRPNTLFSRGFASPWAQLFVSNAQFALDIQKINIELNLMSMDPHNEHGEFKILNVILKHGVKFMSSQLNSCSESSLYVRDNVIDVIVKSLSSQAILSKIVICQPSTVTSPRPLEVSPEDFHLEYEEVIQEILVFQSYRKQNVAISSPRAKLGYYSTLSTLNLWKVQFFVDAQYLSPILLATSVFSSASTFGGVCVSDMLLNYEFVEIKSAKNIWRSSYKNIDHFPLLMNPTSLLSLSACNLDIQFSHEMINVLAIELSHFVFNDLSFGPLIQQKSITFDSLIGMDLTVPSAAHKHFICNLADNTCPCNIFEIHITSRLGECSLFEVRAEQFQYFYLQRSTMTMVNYFRDFLISHINKCRLGGMLFTDQYISSSTVNHEMYKYGNNGMFRLAVSLRQFEVHIPINSFASDSITIIAGHGVFYKRCTELDSILSEYSQGLYLSKRIWISEAKNIQNFISSFSLTSDSLIAIPWHLITHSSDLITPIELPIGARSTRFDMKVVNATICSWCNQNSVGEHLNVDGILSIQSTMLGSPLGLNAEVFEEDTFFNPADESRNRFTVDISSKEVDWILSQGQYAAVVYLIQQNFSELTAVVPEIWLPPTLSLVNLTDKVYGKNSMKFHLPIFSTIPIHISKGKIVAVENANDYYDLVQRPIKGITWKPKETYDNLENDSSLQSYCVVPDYSYHHKYRRKLFSRLPLSRLLRNSGSTIAIGKGSKERDFIPTYGQPFLGAIFHFLEIDFYRRHYGGGNGIEISAETLVLIDHHNIDTENSPNDALSEDDHSDISRSSNLDDISAQTVIFAPNCLDAMSGDKHTKKSKFEFDDIYVETSRNNENSVKETSKKLKSDNDEIIDNREESGVQKLRHIRYSQQGIGNLRRCVISINDSIAVIHINPILTAIKYFTEPIFLYSTRNLGRINARNLGPYDFKSGLDVEVHAKNTVFILPNVTAKDGASGICINSDLHYTHAWRGYLLSGPGKVIANIDLNIFSVFISPLHEVRVVGAESVFDPCLISFNMEFSVLPKKSDLDHHSHSLAPWVDISCLPNRPSRLPFTPIANRVISLTISPRDDTVVQVLPLEQTIMSDGDENDEVQEPSRVLQLRVSLQDVAFLIMAIQQMTNLINSRSNRQLITSRCSYLVDHFHDIDHLPLLTHYLIHVPLKTSWSDCDIDILANICDLQIILRNNTYNLTISKVDLSDIQLSFNRAGDNIHGAAGVMCSIWSFNDLCDVWEPVIEPVKMTSVAATDSTDGPTILDITSSGMFDSSDENSDEKSNSMLLATAPRTKVDVYVNPVEVTLALMTVKNLMRKLSLADVVTTSSAHLPPYLIINELGVSVNCSVGIGSQLITSETVAIGGQLPIEIHQLSKVSLKTKKTTGQKLSSLDVSDDDKEHLLDISFSMVGISYQSVRPLPIDREGTTCFEMKRVQTVNKSEIIADPSKRYFRNSVNPYDEIPFVLLSMRIKEDGGRELVLRSILSFKNLTNRVFQLSVRRDDIKADAAVAPGSEWIVPIQLAHPKSSLYMQVNDRPGWFEAIHSLHGLIIQGNWGQPSKLKAELVTCPPEITSGESQNLSWVVLLRPEVHDSKSGVSSKTTISVRYPTGDRSVLSSQKNESMDGYTGSDDTYKFSRLQAAVASAAFTGSERLSLAQPMSVHLLAPLQFCNLLSIPLLYRLATSDGLILSEGVLLQGEIVDVHNLYHLFISPIFLSIRVINYCWSKWSKILSTKNPFPSQEKIFDIRMATMNLVFEDNEMRLPAIDVSVNMREHFVRFSCPILISNRTGFPLQYCESGNPTEIIPQTSGLPIHNLIQVVKRQKSAIHDSESKLKLQTGLSYTASGESFIEDDSDDDTGISLSPFNNLKSSGLENNGSPRFDSPVAYSKLPGPRLTKSVKIKNLSVHLPQDHYRVAEVAASHDWTLRDVFYRVSYLLAFNTSYQQESMYVFVLWEDGKFGPRRVENMPVKVNAGGADSDDETELSVDDNAQYGASKNIKSGVNEFRPVSTKYSTSNQSVGIPESMRFNMLTDCYPHNILPFDTKIESLKDRLRVRICHVSELYIFNQVTSIRSESEMKESQSFMNIFNRSKIIHRAPFYPWGSEFIPFYKSKMMGFSNFFSIRVESNSEWTEGIDLSRVGFVGGSSSVTVNAWTTIDSPKFNGIVNRVMEYGLFVERGKGFFQSITCVSLVPRHVVISKLSETIELRQFGFDDRLTYLQLRPGGISTIHHHSNDCPKLLQIRRFVDVTSGEEKENLWCGELDINHLGIVYAKLSNPSLIVKVLVEMVGATLVATFSEQNPRWPPYRIENLTSGPIHVRQNVSISLNKGQSYSNEKINEGSSHSHSGHDTDYKPGNDIDESQIIWESIKPQMSISYAWDMPRSGGTILQIEFPQGSGYKRIDTNLDQISKSKSIKILKNSFSYGSPSAEGMLFHREVGDTWNPIYCILKADVLFMFRDETRNDVVGLVHLCKLQASKDSNSSGKDTKIFARINRYVDKAAWGDKLMTSFGLAGNNVLPGQVIDGSKLMFDANQSRILILRLAEKMGLLLDEQLCNEEDLALMSLSKQNSPKKVNNRPISTIQSQSPSTSSPPLAIASSRVSLESILANDKSVEHILEVVSTKPVNARDLIRALVDIGQVDSEIAGLSFFQSMLAEGIIKQSRQSESRVDDIIALDIPDEQEDDGSTSRQSLSGRTTDISQDQARPSLFSPASFIMSGLNANEVKRSRQREKLETLNNVEVFFQAVALNPELTALAMDSKIQERLSEETSDVFGFTIILGSIRHHFRCASMTEYLGWMQACRQNIESSWIESIQKHHIDNHPPITLDSLFTSVSLRVRADGPTKVLEIVEADVKLNNMLDKYVNNKVAKVPKMRRHTINPIYSKQGNSITDALSVKISVQSVGLSLVDGEPVEVLHLSLEDIEMLIDRSRYLVRMAGTVQEIHVANQLLNPLYPVAMFPRYHIDRSTSLDNADSSRTNGGLKLMLPGLNQRGNSLPSLHLYFQERYHVSESRDQAEMNGTAHLNSSSGEIESNQSIDSESNLLYFEMFSIWLAPLQLDLDEELIIRLLRFVQNARQVLKQKSDINGNVVRDEILANQHQGNRTWGIMDPKEASLLNQQFLATGQLCYSQYDIYAKPSRGIYFSLLQLHPVDVLVHIRPSPNYHISATEMAVISIVAQVDSCRFCLNALIAEHAFGSTTMIADVINKHYRAALWRQFQKIIGSADIVEGSVGLVANLGTGVYDLFYEPIDGLMGEGGSTFLDGLSKGGKSLASRTIGGTSAFTSKITGGIGRGVSMLTLDSDFQRTRNSRRLTKATSVSDGIYVGTRELGKNIVDGVTGIVKAPYRGWEEGGGVGFGVGIAKGILGVALKPAVGVFDLASRATEGLRNTAFSDNNDPNHIDVRRFEIRKRIPRPFGRQDVILPFNLELACAQYIADRLTLFKRDARFHVIHHQHLVRNISERPRSQLIGPPQQSSPTSAQSPLGINPMMGFNSPSHEAWGMAVGNSYIAVVDPERIGLFRVLSSRRSRTLEVSFIWSCPTICVTELFSDKKGDLILSLTQTISLTGSWRHPSPVILDKHTQDYVIFQLLMEQTLGLKLARSQALYPRGGLIDTDVLKRLSTGIRSLVYAPTKHTFQLVGHVLYEYTLSSAPPSKSNEQNENPESLDPHRHPSDVYFAPTINSLFGTVSSPAPKSNFIGSNNTNDDTDEVIKPDGYLSFIYPLVDVAILGPFVEDNNRCSISITNRDTTGRIKSLKRDTEDSLLSEYNKTILTLVFSSRDRALVWKHHLEKHMITCPKDVVDSANTAAKIVRNMNRVLGTNAKDDFDEPPAHSIAGMLVIPSSSLNSKDTEILKIEIAKALSASRL